MTLKSFDCYPALHKSRPVGHEQGQAQLAKGQPPQPGAQKRELARGVPKQGEGDDHGDHLDIIKVITVVTSLMSWTQMQMLCCTCLDVNVQCVS